MNNKRAEFIMNIYRELKEVQPESISDYELR